MALTAVTIPDVTIPDGADQVAPVAAIGAPPADRAGAQLAVHRDLPVVLVRLGAAGPAITVHPRSLRIGVPGGDPAEQDRADTIISEWLAAVTTVGGATTSGAITDERDSHSTAVTIMVITAGARIIMAPITGTISLTVATIAADGNMSAMPSTATASAVTREAVITAGTTRVAMAGDRRTLRDTMGRTNWRG